MERLRESEHATLKSLAFGKLVFLRRVGAIAQKTSFCGIQVGSIIIA